MFGFKEPTRTIEVMDDRTSLVDAKLADEQRALASIDLREEARQKVQTRLRPESSGISSAELDIGSPDTQEKVEAIVRMVIEELCGRGLAGRGPVIEDVHAQSICQYVMDWQFGAGPLEPLFREPDVEDIIVNSKVTDRAKPILEVWTYRQSGKRREDIAITADDLREIINRNAGYQGRALNPVNPILNAQMRNGARVNAVLSPVCDPYIAVTIRVHRLIARTFEDLVNLGTLSVPAASWLWLAIRSGLSTVVGGGTGAGKTNLLNALVSVMPANLRCVVIEDTRELTLPANDVPYLVTVQGADGQITVSQRMLVANALRMRPDRIILGEVRGAAAWDAVKACNTGHEGTMLSVHADDAAGVLVRLSQLCGEAHETANIPEKMLREVIASAFQMVVFIERRRQPDGSFKRFVSQINEINGFVSDGVTVQKPLFCYENGELRWTQQWPHDRIKKRVLDAGFSERDIEQALTGRVRFWEIPF